MRTIKGSFIVIFWLSFLFAGSAFAQLQLKEQQLFPVPGNALDLPFQRSNVIDPLFQKPGYSHAIIIDSTLTARLQSVLDSVRVSRNFIGLSAAVSDSAGNIWLGTSGYSVPANADTILAEMIFNIGSVTKTFIAALTMQLIEEGHLSLEDSLYLWIPSHQSIDSTITIRQLLNHTSGINDFLNTSSNWIVAMINDPDSLWHPEDVINTFLGPPDFPKGTQWGYSNTNYILLGMIIEQITGMEVTSELRSRFYQPLGLNSTFLAPDDSLAAPRAHNWHDWYGTGQLIDLYSYPSNAMYSIAWTAGTMFASGENLVRWCAALYRGNVLSPASLAQMVTVEPPSTFYGLGTVVATALGRPVWGHGGSYFGFRTATYYSPQDQVNIAVLLNQNPGEVDFVYLDLLETIINYVPTGIGDEVTHHQPSVFRLDQNYPNPFNPQTTISYQLFWKGTLSGAAIFNVELVVYNMLGQKVKTLVSKRQATGSYTVQWDGRNDTGKPVTSGVYLYRLWLSTPLGKAGEFMQTRKMVLLR
jgi:D-alanyl-D-alanine carboxypeptidase